MQAIHHDLGDDRLAALRARLDEPLPPLALVGRNHGLTAISSYLALLRDDRIQLTEEIDRLRCGQLA